MAPTPAAAIPMVKRNVWFLAGFLLFTAALSIYVLYALWSAAPRTVSGPLPAPACAPGAASLTNIYPGSAAVGAASDVWLIGCNFVNGMAVTFNATQHASLFVDSNHIRVTLSAADVAAPGTIVVGIASGAAPVGSGPLEVVPATVLWSLFFWGPWSISLEVQLLLMVLFTGAFGSSGYALKSLADYRGGRDLYESWFLFYFIQPVEGACAAFLMYLVVRAGFLAGAGGDVKSANQFGVCAIAGLAGAFSDLAFMKLREVFQTLFKPRDDRGDKPVPRITTTSLPDAQVGTAYKAALQASGEASPKWAISPALPAGLSLDKDTGVISGTPTAVSPKTSYHVTATDSATPSATAAADLTLEVKLGALKIHTTALPAPAAGAAYRQTLQATGGTAPLRWAVSPALPAGLALSPDTGVIAGTPAAATPPAPFKFTVSDSAATPASDTATLTL